MELSREDVSEQRTRDTRLQINARGVDHLACHTASAVPGASQATPPKKHRVSAKLRQAGYWAGLKGNSNTQRAMLLSERGRSTD